VDVDVDVVVDGTLIFHWHGKEEVPTQFKFHSNWIYAMANGKPVFHTIANQRKDVSRVGIKPIYDNFTRL